jgi:hypothetical protein
MSPTNHVNPTITIDKNNIRLMAKRLRESRPSELELDVFSMPLGFSEQCLSTQQILRARLMGIMDSDRKHLLSCPLCLKNLKAFSQIPMEPEGFIGKVIEKFDARVTITAIIATPSRVMQLNLASPETRSLEIDLVPLFDLESYHIDRNSFRLQGSLVGGQPTSVEKSDADRDGKPDFLTITFDVKPSEQISDALSKQGAVNDQIRLSGCMSDSQNRKVGLVAQASLEFRRQ